ncbi:hypothetical protein BgiMline_034328, partial [Biomphalaria glabrata]
KTRKTWKISTLIWTLDLQRGYKSYDKIVKEEGDLSTLGFIRDRGVDNNGHFCGHQHSTPDLRLQTGIVHSRPTSQGDDRCL